MNKPLLCFALAAIACLAVVACHATGELSAFTVETTTSPSGSLLVHGRCAVADGVQVLIHVIGGREYGAHLETAIVTPVVRGRYFADLGVYQPLEYRVEVSLGPRFNPHVDLPPKPYRFEDPNIDVRDDGDTWEIFRRATHRLGSVEEERRLVRLRVDRLAAALYVLQRYGGELQKLEAKGPAGLARWYRLYWENRHKTLLGEPSVDPLYPALHNRLIQVDQTLQRRFHAVLAAATGQTDEVDRLGATSKLLAERLARAARELKDIQAKLPEAG